MRITSGASTLTSSGSVALATAAAGPGGVLSSRSQRALRAPARRAPSTSPTTGASSSGGVGGMISIAVGAGAGAAKAQSGGGVQLLAGDSDK